MFFLVLRVEVDCNLIKDGGILSSKRDAMTIFYSVTPDIKEDLIRIIK